MFAEQPLKQLHNQRLLVRVVIGFDEMTCRRENVESIVGKVKAILFCAFNGDTHRWRLDVGAGETSQNEQARCCFARFDTSQLASVLGLVPNAFRHGRKIVSETSTVSGPVFIQFQLLDVFHLWQIGNRIFENQIVHLLLELLDGVLGQ